MSKQINQYTKTRTAATIQNDDLIDIDSTEDNGTSYESSKLSFSELLIKVNQNVSTFYSGNGEITNERNVILNNNNLSFIGGQLILKMNDSVTDRAFRIEDDASNEFAYFGYNQFDDTAELSLSYTSGEFFTAKDGKVDSKEGYSVNGVPFLKRFQNIGASYIMLGENAAITEGGNGGGIAIGQGADTFGSGIAIGLDSLVNNSIFNAVAIGRAATVNANHSIAIGRGSIANGSGVAIGFTAICGANQFVVGGDNSANIKTVLFGRGDDCLIGDLSNLTFRMTNLRSGHPNSNASNNMIFEASKGRGTGVGGNIEFKTSTAGASGDVLNTVLSSFIIKQNGVLNASRLPTSSAGLVSGDIWNNGGVLNIV